MQREEDRDGDEGQGEKRNKYKKGMREREEEDNTCSCSMYHLFQTTVLKKLLVVLAGGEYAFFESGRPPW